MYIISIFSFFHSFIILGVPLVPRVGLYALVPPKYGGTPLQSLTHTAAFRPDAHLITNHLLQTVNCKL